jgi:hypothetical protein
MILFAAINEFCNSLVRFRQIDVTTNRKLRKSTERKNDKLMAS